MTANVLFVDVDLNEVGRSRLRRVPPVDDLVVFESPRSAWKVSRVVWVVDRVWASLQPREGVEAVVVLVGTNEEARAFGVLDLVADAVVKVGRETKEEGEGR